MGIVLNWIVQGLVVAAAADLAVRLVRRAGAVARYRSYCLAVGLIAALPAVPAIGAALRTLVDAALWTSAGPTLAQAPLAQAAGSARPPVVAVPAMVWNATAVCLGLWAVWVVLHGLRFAGDVRKLRTARARCQPLPCSLAMRLRTATVARLTQAGARLALSEDVRAAGVLGWGRPIVALQPRIAAQLTDDELDQMIAHELAHVTRRDTRATALQQAVQVFGGWHPAISWMIRRLRVEREMACDEMAIAASGSPRAYAACLARLAALTHTARPSALAVGALASSGLRQRVVRALALEQIIEPAGRRPFAPVVAAVLIVVTLAAGSLGVFGLHVPSVDTLQAASARAAHGWEQWTGAGTRAAQPSGNPPAVAVGRPDDVNPGASPKKAPSLVAAPGPVVAEQARVAPVDAAERTDATDTVEPATLPARASAHLPALVWASTVAAPVMNMPATAPSPDGADHGAATIAAAASAAGNTVAGDAAAGWDAASGAASDAAVTIGRRSRNAAVATAGFFTRAGRRVAASAPSF